jgi:deoxyribodipyrimidine photo-lyase
MGAAPAAGRPSAQNQSMPSTALVWLKRDLRLADHAPLAAARGFERALALYIIEPEWLASSEFDGSHLEFTLACLAELRARGLPLRVCTGSAVTVLAALRRETGFSHLLSHEETGPGWTYQRDLAVAAWCREQGLPWQEFAQTGVVRRLKTRNGWAARWAVRMNAPQADSHAALGGALGGADPLPNASALGVAPHGKALQAAGETAAQAVLHDFLDTRGGDYRRALSSPLTAGDGCSRLSPHLAFGTLSMRQVHQATEARIGLLSDGTPAERRFAHALRGFAGRLRWHCHFMQKLEDEPAIEFRNFSRACDGLRPGDVAGGAAPFADAERTRLHAWCEGRTGYPMVDACLRSLRATGWLNFRMRAMLVSFASYHLWLHWRDTGAFLARQFLDFEAGIHWSQMQMQSGTTGINTLRIYSPAKQAADHDPEGIFIRRWVPELAGVPLAALAEPARLSAAEQRAVGCVIGRDYPAPLVEHTAAMKHAKDRLYGLRGDASARREADAIQQRHGSRKSGLPPSGRPAGPPRTGARRQALPSPADTAQLDLFAGGDAE